MNRPIAGFFAFSAFLSLGIVVPACGGDDTSPTGTGGTGGATTGTAGSGGGKAGSGGSGGTTGGTGGTGGTAGKGGGTVDSGADTGGGMTIMCGNKTCGEIELPMIGLAPPCCPPAEMNACGASFMGLFCFTTTPGTPDPSCPAVTFPGAPAPIPGCCGASGFCGAEIGAPLGCNDLSVVIGGTPTPCGGDAAPPMRDSGPDMAPPPPDTGTSDTGGGTDTGGGNDGTVPDSTPGDAPSTDGGGSEGGSADASGDRAG
jgi:hypothetical protein